MSEKAPQAQPAAQPAKTALFAGGKGLGSARPVPR